MTDNNNNNEEKIWPLLLLMACVILLWLCSWWYVDSVTTQLTDRGTFGDKFGFINSLFSGLALAGIIYSIILQKRELALQRLELKETRKEFLLNRTTNLVYSQLDRFEKSLAELTIAHNGKTYVGNDAISFLDENKEQIYRPLDKPEEEYKAEMRVAIVKLLKIYIPNKSQIEKFAQNAYNSVEVFKRLIFKTELDIDELNHLKKLFFDNIGFINMGVIERISDLAETEFDYLVDEDYDNNNLEMGRMRRANIFLKSIKKFYHQRLTKDNFAELKAEWIKSR